MANLPTSGLRVAFATAELAPVAIVGGLAAAAVGLGAELPPSDPPSATRVWPQLGFAREKVLDLVIDVVSTLRTVTVLLATCVVR